MSKQLNEEALRSELTGAPRELVADVAQKGQSLHVSSIHEQLKNRRMRLAPIRYMSGQPIYGDEHTHREESQLLMSPLAGPRGPLDRKRTHRAAGGNH